ncbi:MAG: nucleotidyltransferase family protein [bacterium]|nr:nucleotidyltransferase family protein [bacterium]MBU1918641.1 nucleotidyltransferase family protein [bacterium]
MKALILAAGFGTRMRPFTNTKPKALVPVNDIPLILYNLAFLKSHGIKDVVINLHHQGSLIKKLLKNGKSIGLNITYSHEPTILGTGGGINKALRFLHNDFLVLNSDIITDFDLKELISVHKKQHPLATLALYKHTQAKKYGLLYAQENQLVSILNEPVPPKGSQAAMFSGIHILNKDKIKVALNKAQPLKNFFCIMRSIYMPELKSKTNLGAFPLQGFWTVCDSLNDVQKTTKALKNKKISLRYTKSLHKMAQSIL